MIIDDVTEEVIGHLIETGNLDQLYQLGSCARGHPQEQSGLDFLVVSKINVKIVDIEMVCLQDPIKPMHIPADILKISKSTVNLRACSKNRYRRTIVL